MEEEGYSWRKKVTARVNSIQGKVNTTEGEDYTPCKIICWAG